MIKAIEISGFQSHKSTIVELSPGINILVGETDHGKSAFNRALKWLFRNKPMGDDFRNWDMKVNEVVEVAAVFTDDTYVVRRKGKGVNEYVLSTKEDPLKALKTDIPQEVFEVTRINDINLQRQASWFLLDEKSGQVARQFNELAELSVMDASLSIVNVRVREAKAKASVYKDQIEGYEEKLKKLDVWLQPALIEMKSIEENEIYLNELSQKEYRLISLLNELDEIREKLAKLAFVKEADLALIEIKNIKLELEDKKQHATNIRTLTESIGTVRSKLNVYANIRQIEIELNEVLNIEDELSALKSKNNTVRSLLQQITSVHHEQMNVRGEIERTEKDIQDKLKQLGICPLCGKAQ